MKKILSVVWVAAMIFAWFNPLIHSVEAQSVDQIDYMIQCGEQLLEGSVETSNRDETSLSVVIAWDDGVYTRGVSMDVVSENNVITVDADGYNEWWYDIVIEASMMSQSVEKRYAVYFENGTCDTAKAVKERIVKYAQEAQEYFENNEEVQNVPTQFLKTGLWNRVDNVIKGTSQKFALSSSPVFNNTPERTRDPFAANQPTFEEQYAYVPQEYRGAEAYIQFKWLLVPIVLPQGGEDESALLKKLDTWALLAPETPSLDTLGAVKMIYTHSLSFSDSPFSWVGAFLSVFAEEGDEFSVYVKKWYVSYEKRTYVMTRRMQIKPEQTDLIKNFKKDGADTIAMITCKDGQVLWSTLWREVLFLERKTTELSDFQRVLVMIDSIPLLSKQKDELDAYLENAELSDEAVIKMVKQLEKIENETGNPLQTIATYGKYMAAYNAIYDS